MAMRKKLATATTVLAMLLLSAVTTIQLVNSKDSLCTTPLITMPEEYIKYTITTINGSLWAKIDGTYPLHVLFWHEPLMLVYPTPPG
jgi:hypothetical protein